MKRFIVLFFTVLLLTLFVENVFSQVGARSKFTDPEKTEEIRKFIQQKLSESTQQPVTSLQVINIESQVVAGTNYYVTVEATFDQQQPSKKYTVKVFEPLPHAQTGGEKYKLMTVQEINN
ncbi:hypothetical protein ABK040_012940 [Willaertia magna]